MGKIEGQWGVIDYVTEEVSRQGHDVKALDGITRVGWMLNAWVYALLYGGPLTLTAAIKIATLVEVEKNANGLRICQVRVGSRRCCPDFKEVPNLLVDLFLKRDTLTPIEFYREFELIHPFVDGNGRTGKILYNMVNGTLLQPIFPPADLFGYPIRNP